MSLSRLSIALFCALPLGPALGHEYWLSPENYQVEKGEDIAVNFRNGENFSGAAYSYLPGKVTRLEVIAGGETRPVTARAGDIPALQITAPETEGLVVAVLETAPAIVTYTEWEKFLSFADHKDFPDAAAEHAASGWPQDRFKESYTRHAKSLIAVGDGRGADAAVGLETEFVALSNPYAPEFDGRMKVALTYQGEPRADAQIEVFDRAPDGTVTVTLQRTDAAGEAVIPVSAGHDYLLDAVVLRPAAEADKVAETPNQPVWETLWAALTFHVPR